MSARFIVSNDIDVTIHDDVPAGKIWVEVEVKVPGPDKGKHQFDAGVTPYGAVKVRDKVEYGRLAKYAPFPLVLEYGVLV